MENRWAGHSNSPASLPQLLVGRDLVSWYLTHGNLQKTSSTNLPKFQVSPMTFVVYLVAQQFSVFRQAWHQVYLLLVHEKPQRWSIWEETSDWTLERKCISCFFCFQTTLGPPSRPTLTSVKNHFPLRWIWWKVRTTQPWSSSLVDFYDKKAQGPGLTHIIPSQVISEDEKDVWRLGGAASAIRQWHHQQENGAGPQQMHGAWKQYSGAHLIPA